MKSEETSLGRKGRRTSFYALAEKSALERGSNNNVEKRGAPWGSIF